MVVTSLDPEVNGLLSIPNFPNSILIISKLVLADTIINEHVAVCVLTVINVDDEGGPGALISMRRRISSRLIIVLLWNDLSRFNVNGSFTIYLF